MLVEDFAVGQRDHVVRAEGGYRAFVPPTLPPVLPLNAALIRQLSALRSQMRDEVATVKSSALPAKLVDALFEVPVMTIPRAKDLLGVTHRAATQHVERLVALGMLTEIHHGRRPRRFIASGIMAAVEGRA